MITIIDFSSGNLKSLVKKLNDFGFEAEYSNKPEVIGKAEFLLLPGVGHFGTAMNYLKNEKLIKVLHQKVIVEKTPIIGICLGMQLFSKYSEEGNVKGLGWIDATTKLFRFKEKLTKVPHIGWNRIMENKLQSNYTEDQINHRYYFVHSYFVECQNQNDVISFSEYGGSKFCSSLKSQHIMGFQFHPEKSHKKGMNMLADAITYQMKEYAK